MRKQRQVNVYELYFELKLVLLDDRLGELMEKEDSGWPLDFWLQQVDGSVVF